MNKKKEISSSITGALLSLLSALGLLSCCGFPILAGVLAWLGIGASQLSFFAEYHSFITGLAIIALTYSFYVLYLKTIFDRKEISNCESTIDATSCCSTPTKKTDKIAKLFFWIGVIAVTSTMLMSHSNEKSIDENECCTTKQEKPVSSEQSNCCTSSETNTKQENK